MDNPFTPYDCGDKYIPTHNLNPYFEPEPVPPLYLTWGRVRWDSGGWSGPAWEDLNRVREARKVTSRRRSLYTYGCTGMAMATATSGVKCVKCITLLVERLRSHERR